MRRSCLIRSQHPGMRRLLTLAVIHPETPACCLLPSADRAITQSSNHSITQSGMRNNNKHEGWEAWRRGEWGDSVCVICRIG
ncbi:hypothetical protein BZA05DRAFT_397706 [Tricharina praecox]|uniref:uncharacterized protein n=1 Tax=Tricharina praecox TaxID=43433 RepID=UPI0022212200|nr:uncharacterized protein BZA05DRAFT_397706 [Tricharina praecox]KAI5852378.1 hypothetical protein BZA05DRAFT_397706 [Tricharina praecox]